MSASLVGSEMCIRDSFSRAQPCEQTVNGPDTANCTDTATRPDAANTGPVSYTHLTLPTICSV
eukprot:11890899-Alexandrium_andersonii.AAC.1